MTKQYIKDMRTIDIFKRLNNHEDIKDGKGRFVGLQSFDYSGFRWLVEVNQEEGTTTLNPSLKLNDETLYFEEKENANN